MLTQHSAIPLRSCLQQYNNNIKYNFIVSYSWLFTNNQLTPEKSVIYDFCVVTMEECFNIVTALETWVSYPEIGWTI